MPEMFSSAQVTAALQRCAGLMVEQEAYFTELDQQVGDGDLGITLAKIGAALQEFSVATPVDGDVGKYLGKAGMAANKAGSSSFGTLLATALMRAGKVAGGKGELSAADLAAMLSAADMGMQERGKTQPGVRWKTLTSSADFTSSGMIWTALAPVPTTATRLPCSCTSCRQWLE